MANMAMSICYGHVYSSLPAIRSRYVIWSTTYSADLVTFDKGVLENLKNVLENNYLDTQMINNR